MIVELILALFLERTTRKDNRNSSLPSSQTGLDESALVSGGQGKGKRLDKRSAVNSRTVEMVHVSNVSTCEVCGEPLTDVPCLHHERRTKIDIVFEKDQRIDELKAELSAEQTRRDQQAAKHRSEHEAIRSKLDSVRTELVKVVAKAEAVEETHQEQRKRAAEEIQRAADKLMKLEGERDNAKVEAVKAREDAAKLAGRLEATNAQIAQLMQAIGKKPLHSNNKYTE